MTDFMNEMQNSTNFPKSLSEDELALLKRFVTNKSAFKEKLEQLKRYK